MATWETVRTKVSILCPESGPLPLDSRSLNLKLSMAKLDGGTDIRTITRADLSEVVYQRVGLSRTESGELVEMVLREMALAFARGETVKLSSFGSFIVREKGERIGRNPKTGIEVPIKPRRVLVFKPSNILKSRINGQPVADDGE